MERWPWVRFARRLGVWGACKARPRLFVGLGALVWLILSPSLAQKPQVVIGTGGVGGVYFYYGTAVAEILNKAGVVQAQAIQSGGSIENLMLLRDRTDPARGLYYCGTVLPDAALMAFSGEERFQGKPVPVRILFTMYPNYFHVVTTEESGIRVLQDLRGKRVSTEVPGASLSTKRGSLCPPPFPALTPRSTSVSGSGCV